MRTLPLMFVSVLLVLLVSLAAGASGYNEAPMLAERVASGELPPVDERLPNVPFVIEHGTLIAEEDVEFSIGRYGGTLRTAHVSPGFSPNVFNMVNEPLLIAQSITLTGIQGNMVEEFSVEENRIFNFTLREGLKWSDGTPVTTEDVRFAVEDYWMNEDLTPLFPTKFRTGGRSEGTPMEVNVIDDYSFQLIFDEPYGSFMEEIVIKGWIGYTELIKPSHYLKNYHIDYTPIEDMQEELLGEELDDEWWTLFNLRDISHWDATREEAIGFPVLYPWHRVESPAGLIIMERNPYYHGVDGEGNQLPYIDRLESEEVTDIEMVNMKILVGEVDFLQGRTSIANMPLYLENQERGGYRVNPNMVLHLNPTVLFLNYTNEDPVWRDVVSDVRFREALSLGMDREEIIDTVYLGYAHPTSLIPSDYDPERAKQLLDEMGMDARDSEGYRLAPDGEPFELYIEVADHRPDHVPTVELLIEYYEDLGLNTTMRYISRELQGQRQAANESLGTMGWTHAPIWGAGGTADYLPGTWGWGQAWRTWYDSGGTSGEEPPEHIKELFGIHEDLATLVPDTEEHNAARAALYDWYMTHIPIIIVAEDVANPMITHEHLANVPHAGFGIGANQRAVQWYFTE